MRSRPTWIMRLGLVSVMFVSVGCAFTDISVRMPERSASTTGLRRGDGRDVMVLAPFIDRRHQERCGMKKNGFNADTANIRCSTSPELSLPRLLAAELKAAGFRVVASRSQATSSTLVLAGRLDQLFTEPDYNFFTSTWETDIALHVTVTTNAGLVAERTFSVKGEEATLMNEGDAQRSFDSAVHKLVIAVVGALANLSDRFPSSSVPVAFEPATGRASP